MVLLGARFLDLIVFFKASAFYDSDINGFQ